MDLRVLYRGPLESCNYGCTYCPFAKKVDDRATLARDRDALERFVARIAELRQHRFGVFFTPWGEALVRRAYRDAMVALSHAPNVDRVAIQTNLSAPISFASRANAQKLGLWATFHPEWVPRARFVRKVHALRDAGVRVSVGVVGFRRFTAEIEAIRRELPQDVYVWINAVKSTPAREPYDDDDLARFAAIDPLFPVNLQEHASRDRACRTGESVFSVDGDGVMRRCHFVKTPIGNFYQDFSASLRPRPCPAPTCGCHIGYVHLEHLGLDGVFGDGILERVPQRMLPVVPSSAARISQP